jgi:aspartate racemase
VEFSAKKQKVFFEQMRLLRAKGAEGIILGCTELPMLIESKDIDIPLIATTQLHARMAANFILEVQVAT